jgi:hypothetical protein
MPFQDVALVDVHARDEGRRLRRESLELTVKVWGFGFRV